ncbi:MAG: hypothetical protein Q4G03_08940, partial [Planctomycetia bacterium]|nr:hypothetical protein [Planctomycetia bacterium]
MKRLRVQLLALATATLFMSLMNAGCEKQPELDFSEYGQTIDHLPVVRDLPVYFSIADEVETKPCRIREDVQRACQDKLYSSQGRERELEMKREAQREKENQEERERRAKLKAEREALNAQAEDPQTSEKPEQEDTVNTETVQEEAAEPEQVQEEAAEP